MAMRASERVRAPEKVELWEGHLVVNLPHHLVEPFQVGLIAGSELLPESSCPYLVSNPEYRAMWFEGHYVGSHGQGTVYLKGY